MTDEGESPYKNLHVLVVEDDEGSRATIVDYLRQAGVGKITQANHGADAVRVLDRDISVNFIISDWEMPLVNGLQLLQRVRAGRATAHLPYLIVTSPISEEQEKILLAAENLVDAYVIKPFRSQTLREKIEAILERSVHGPQKEVVVVDDDQDAREMVTEYLKSLGFGMIAVFPNGKKALDYLRAHREKVGLIISDWEMPEISGVELLRACKLDKGMQDIPFLMITSQSSVENMKVLQAARSRVDQYLLKPFSRADLKARVDRVLKKSRSRAQFDLLVRDADEHVGRGQYAAAKKCYRQALELDPEYDAAERGLGEVILRTEGAEAAIPHFRKAVDLNPYNARNYLDLAAAYEQQRWYEKAVELLQNGVARVNFSADLHFHLGRMLHKQGNNAAAKAEFEKTLEIQLDHREAHLMLRMMK